MKLGESTNLDGNKLGAASCNDLPTRDFIERISWRVHPKYFWRDRVYNKFNAHDTPAHWALSSHLNHFHKVLGKFLLGKGQKTPPFCRAMPPQFLHGCWRTLHFQIFVRLPSPLIRLWYGAVALKSPSWFLARCLFCLWQADRAIPVRKNVGKGFIIFKFSNRPPGNVDVQIGNFRNFQGAPVFSVFSMVLFYRGGSLGVPGPKAFASLHEAELPWLFGSGHHSRWRSMIEYLQKL